MSFAKPPFDYEAVVYTEEASALASEILDAIGRVSIPDERVRRAIIAAALTTAAQRCDGNERADVEIPDGIASAVRLMLTETHPPE